MFHIANTLVIYIITTKPTLPYICILHTKRRLYSQRCIVIQEQKWLATLHAAVSFRLIVCDDYTKKYYHTSLRFCCQAARKRNIKNGQSFSTKMNYKKGYACKKIQKKGRDENTRRLTCYRKIVVKNVMPDYATDVD